MKSPCRSRYLKDPCETFLSQPLFHSAASAPLPSPPEPPAASTQEDAQGEHRGSTSHLQPAECLPTTPEALGCPLRCLTSKQSPASAWCQNIWGHLSGLPVLDVNSQGTDPASSRCMKTADPTLKCTHQQLQPRLWHCWYLRIPNPKGFAALP